ncbi:MAG: adenylate kinase family protein [Candidatus Aenigmarchaeota archaeon]|nr:adenylate kinase family protein [Candidatus Aenigmarchaeota archaeon]
MRKIIAITGTPGVGKSTLAKILKSKGWAVLELNRAVVRKKLYSGYDKKLKSYIADQRKINKYVKLWIGKQKNERIAVVSHLSHLLPTKLVSAVIVLRCSPIVLEKRLKKRKYSKIKIKENMEAELVGVISCEAKQKHSAVYEFDCTSSVNSAFSGTEKVFKGQKVKRKQIDWLV